MQSNGSKRNFYFGSQNIMMSETTKKNIACNVFIVSLINTTIKLEVEKLLYHCEKKHRSEDCIQQNLELSNTDSFQQLYFQFD